MFWLVRALQLFMLLLRRNYQKLKRKRSLVTSKHVMNRGLGWPWWTATRELQICTLPTILSLMHPCQMSFVILERCGTKWRLSEWNKKRLERVHQMFDSWSLLRYYLPRSHFFRQNQRSIWRGVSFAKMYNWLIFACSLSPLPQGPHFLLLLSQQDDG